MLNVPKLRFGEFEGEWVEKRLNQISNINPKSTSLPIEFIYIDLESVEKGLLVKSDKVSKSNAPSRAKRVLELDDILFQTVRPYQKNNYFFKLNGHYVASTGYAQIRANESSEFLYQKLHTDKFVNSVLLRCTGTSYPAINSTDLSKIKIFIPQKPEQQKIATFLTAIDQKIEQLTKKEKLLVAYKKGVMQKIFSQEIRFRGDDGEVYGDWVERRLCDVSKYIKGFAFKSEDYTDNGVRIVRVSDLGIDKINDENGVYIKSSKEDNYIKYKIQKENIIITTVGSNPDLLESAVGRAIYIQKENEGLLNQNMLKLENNDFVNNKFIHSQLNSLQYIQHIRAIKRGNANQANITVKEILEFKIKIAILSEQTKIANFLSSIDKKIEQVNKQIEESKSFKKGLLQQMFV